MKEGSHFKAVFVVSAWKVQKDKDLVHEGMKLFQCNTCEGSFLQWYLIKGCIPRTIQLSAEICKIYIGVHPDLQQTKKWPCTFDSPLQKGLEKSGAINILFSETPFFVTGPLVLLGIPRFELQYKGYCGLFTVKVMLCCQ